MEADLQKSGDYAGCADGTIRDFQKKVQLALEKIIADKRIERVGSDRNGRWKVNE